MQRIPVISSCLRSVGFDESSVTLEIEFIDGGIYQYSRVPDKVHASLMSAASKGSYFDRNIRKAGYPCKKIL
jgi:hypothetical protein